MKTIVVKVNNATQTVSEYKVITHDGQPTVISVSDNVNYELVDSDTGYAPKNIFTRRVDDDIHITMDNDGVQTDLIIAGFYERIGNELIGLAEDDNYYHYVPVNGLVDSFIATLDKGDAKSQILGGDVQTSPWWVDASTIEDIANALLTPETENNITAQASPESSVKAATESTYYADGDFSVLPWLVGLTGLGVIGSDLIIDSDNSLADDASDTDNDTDLDESELATPTITTDSEGDVLVGVSAEQMTTASKLTVDYVNSSKDAVSMTIIKADKWQVDGALPEGVSLDAETGNLKLASNTVDNMSAIKVTAEDASGNQTESVRLGSGDDVVLAEELTADFFDAGEGTDVLELTFSEVLDDGSHINPLHVAGFEVIHYVGDDNHYNIDSRYFAAGDDDKTYINNSGDNNVLDLGNNNTNNADNKVDLGDWMKSDYEFTQTDALGETHTYDLYGNGTVSLYVETSITVI